MQKSKPDFMDDLAAEVLGQVTCVPAINERLMELSTRSSRIRGLSWKALRKGASNPLVNQWLLGLAKSPPFDSTYLVGALQGATSELEIQMVLLDLLGDAGPKTKEAATQALQHTDLAPKIWRRLLELTRDGDDDLRSGL